MIKEELRYSDYTVYESKPSRIDKHKTLRIEMGFKCPQCKRNLPALEHLGTITCTCKLKMTRRGNLLECVK